MRRSDLSVFVPWLLVPLTGLWFALPSFRPPDLRTMAVEIVGWVVIGLAQARFAPPGWARSALWPGVLPVLITATALGPTGWAGLVHLVGLVVLAGALVVRVERATTTGLLVGLLAAVAGGVVVRAQVLTRAEQGSGRQTSVSAGVAGKLVAEIVRPLRAAPAATGNDGPPLVLITVDTLRADAGANMEVAQRLSQRGRAFTQAVSTSSWTVPAMGSVMTGLLPVGHGAGIAADGRLGGLRGDVPVLAELLSDAGYATAAVATNAWLTPGLGFDRGFQTFWHGDERRHHRLPLGGFPQGSSPRDAERVVDHALTWLDTAPERGWFLWVHLIDPHLPFGHPEDAFVAGLSDERLRAGMRLDAEKVEAVRSAYQHEVDHVDAQVGRLLDALEARGVLEAGVVVLTADHGEELWDHGATGHGHSHHREVVQVPLVIAGAPVGVSDAVVSLADVPVTLAAAAGLSIGDGVDLRGDLAGDRIVTSQGNAYFHQQRAAWGRGRRAIVGSAGEVPLDCFDLTADPTEHTPLACAPADPVADAAVRTQAPTTAGGADVSRAALEALGYLAPDE